MINEFIKKSLKIDRPAIEDDIRNSKDAEFFKPNGVQMFCGMQGSGKTYSMVKALLHIKEKYPKCIVVTNLKLNVDFDYVTFSTLEELSRVLTEINNGKFGVVYAIDEIQNYFNSLESKSIPPWVFTEISQQRKQRKLIMGTSQLFLRVAKPFREQVDSVILCRCIGNLFCINTVLMGCTITEIDGEFYGEIVKRGFFFQTRACRESYDTYQVIFRGATRLESNTAADYGVKNIKHQRLAKLRNS